MAKSLREAIGTKPADRQRFAKLADPLTVTDLSPTEDRVLIEPLEPEEMTAGGIVLASATAERDERTHGRVIAVGPGRYDAEFHKAGQLDRTWYEDHGAPDLVPYPDNGIVPMRLNLGDEVYYEGRYALEIERNGRTFYVMREAAVTVVVRPLASNREQARKQTARKAAP